MVHLTGPNGSVELDITNLMANAKIAEREMHKRASAAILRDVAEAIKAMNAFDATVLADDDFEVADIVLEGKSDE